RRSPSPKTQPQLEEGEFLSSEEDSTTRWSPELDRVYYNIMAPGHHATNLAGGAPRIAEGALGTAFGVGGGIPGRVGLQAVGAAIPAVVVYNVFARSIAGHGAGLGDDAAEVLRLVSRTSSALSAPTSPARRATPLSAIE